MVRPVKRARRALLLFVAVVAVAVAAFELGLTDRPQPNLPLQPHSGDLPEIGLTQAVATEWSEYIQPHGEEASWRSISWRTNVWDAILEAREANKPLLIWSMNGHPEGFT